MEHPFSLEDFKKKNYHIRAVYTYFYQNINFNPNSCVSQNY